MIEPPAPPSRERLPLSLFAALGEIAAAAALVRAEGAFFVEHALGHSIQTEGGLNILGSVEARFFLGHVVAGIPAAFLLADAAARLLGGQEAPWSSRLGSRPRLAAFLFSVFAAVVTWILASAVLGHMHVTDDEGIYLAQARDLLEGSFSAPAPGVKAAFHYSFMIDVGSDRWAGVYPPGQPLLMAIGLVLAHNPAFLQPFLAGGAVYVAARMAEDLWDAETAVLTAALLGSSPFLLFNAATLLNAVPATFFCILALRSTCLAIRRGRRSDHVLAGVALGAAFLCRPFDAAMVGLPLGIALLRSAIQRPTPATPVRGTGGLAWAVAGAMPAVLIYLEANAHTTGSAFLPAYSLWLERNFPGAKTVGFGQTVFGGTHTIQLMFSKGLVVLVRLSTWMFGWPFSLWPLLALVLGVGRDSRSRLPLAVLGTHFAGYCLYTGNAIQDTGSPYHLVEVPIVALLSARALVAMSNHLRHFGERLALWPGRLAMASALIGLLTFWPDEIGWMHRTAAAVRAPLAAAEAAVQGGPAIVLWTAMYPPGHGPGSQLSWVLHPPVPGPELSDPILWAKDLGPENALTLSRFPMRRPYQLVWDHNTARVVPYPAEDGAATAEAPPQ